MIKPLNKLSTAIVRVVRSPAFLVLTFLGNGFICICGVLFYYIEKGTNPSVKGFIDGLWWAFATATTTGYGDITPVTLTGKLLSIFLMLSGLALFAMYTALFAESILVLERERHR
jgi:voltage-gated potassium channel